MRSATLNKKKKSPDGQKTKGQHTWQGKQRLQKSHRKANPRGEAILRIVGSQRRTCINSPPKPALDAFNQHAPLYHGCSEGKCATSNDTEEKGELEHAVGVSHTSLAITKRTAKRLKTQKIHERKVVWKHQLSRRPGAP